MFSVVQTAEVMDASMSCCCREWLPDDVNANVGVVLGYTLKRYGTGGAGCGRLAAGGATACLPVGWPVVTNLCIPGDDDDG